MIGERLPDYPPEFDDEVDGTALMEQVAEHFGLSPDATEAQIEKAIYGGTSCGAWITFTETGLVVGSIIEGSDANCTEHTLDWTGEENVGQWLDEALSEIEAEADTLWNEAQ